jgi:hypothetical protein
MTSDWRIEDIPPGSIPIFKCAVCGKRAYRMCTSRGDSVPVCLDEACARWAGDHVLPARRVSRDQDWNRRHPQRPLTDDEEATVRQAESA